MKRAARNYIYILITCAVYACGKGSGADLRPAPPPLDPPTDTTTNPSNPSTAILSIPANNSACLNGVEVDDTLSTVTFQWQASAGAESYDLVLSDITTGKQYTKNSAVLNLALTLRTGHSYKWYIVSRFANSSTTYKSGVWQFYLAGAPVSSYAPFPATAIAPLNNEVINSGGATSINVQLKWQASDIDNDIDFYTVYFDQVDASTKIIASQTGPSITRIVTPGKTYYWRIVTTDKTGNSSDSGKFVFIVE